MQPNPYMRIAGCSPAREEEPSVLLKFAYDKKNNLSSCHKGTIVFVSQNYEGTVRDGEVWICNIERSDRCWYATPLRQVDDQFYMGLTHGQIGEMAKYLWETDREMLMPYIEETASGKLRTEIDNLKKELDSSAESYSSAESQILTLKEEREKLLKEIEALRSKEDSSVAEETESRKLMDENTELKCRVKELQHQLMSLRNRMVCEADDSEPQCKATVRSFADRSVILSGPNELYSRSFKDGRYDVRTDICGTKIVIRQDDNGQAESVNGMIVLDDLENFVEFSERTELPADIDDNGTITCSLKAYQTA
ncbi:MAG: hypothetical protein WCR17_03325 [Candidatus Methanomethylophilaceae archaeon]